jgi:hypothetical protein
MVNKAVVDGKEVKVSRIESLKSDEIGYLKISNFKQDGVDASKTVGTILIVDLAKPILPNTKTTFTLDFDGQVPVQIRRSSRNNLKELHCLWHKWWYPKNIDFEGWHALTLIS